MPWDIRPEHPSCPASKPWAVVKSDDGDVEGCHATEADAKKQLAALNASEETMSVSRPPDIDVVRAITIAPPALRAATDEDDGLGLLYGHFSRFDRWYEVSSMWEGEFLERVAPGAFAQTIADDRESMRILFDHGFDPQIGNKVLGPIRELREDDTGPYYEAPLFDTSYNRDLLPGLKRGVYGASMRMRVQADAWDDEPEPSGHNPRGIPERTITRAAVPEFGPVTFPANPGASAGVRSNTDLYYDRLRERDTSAFEAAVRAAGRSIPDFTGRSDARSAGGGDPDAEPRRGKAPTVLTPRQRLDDGALRLRRIIK